MAIIHSFEDIPKDLVLFDGSTGTSVPAKYVRLTREMCKDKIDKLWWSFLEIARETRRSEPDFAWKWADLFGEVRSEHGIYMQAWAIETVGNGNIQGAILYSTNSTSTLNEGDEDGPPPAVWVSYLATAPWNRPRVRAPKAGLFIGVGESLLKLAMAHSYFIQGGGCVNLRSVDHPDTMAWYLRRGFIVCNEREEGSKLLELPETAARTHLAKWGLS